MSAKALQLCCIQCLSAAEHTATCRNLQTPFRRLVLSSSSGNTSTELEERVAVCFMWGEFRVRIAVRKRALWKGSSRFSSAPPDKCCHTEWNYITKASICSFFFHHFTLWSPVVTICTAQWSLYVLHSGHYMYRTVVSICTAQWSLYVPPSGHYMYRTVVTTCTASLTFNNSTFCPHSVFMCFVWIWEQTAIISLHSTDRLVFITETELCLLRGTGWICKGNSNYYISL
jgi:hypothetical protein